MAIKKITYSSPVCLLHVPCSEILFCLKGDWSLRIASGVPFLVGRLEHSGRKLGTAEGECCCCPSIDNARGDVQFQYELSYDDAQLNIDGGTGQPYEVLCSDICGVSQDPCARLLLDIALAP